MKKFLSALLSMTFLAAAVIPSLCVSAQAGPLTAKSLTKQLALESGKDVSDEFHALGNGCNISYLSEMLLKINQDIRCNQPFNVSSDYLEAPQNPCMRPVYVRLLDDGDIAIGFFNLSDEKSALHNHMANLDVIGLPESTGKTLQLTNIWTGEQEIVTNGVITVELELHTCRLYRGRVMNQPTGR